MPFIPADQYIGLTRAKETVVVISTRGQVVDRVFEISASEVPAVLNLATNGTFKMEWAPYLHGRAHIRFEELDEQGKFAEMRAVLESDAKLGKFLRFHMKMTSGMWAWHFTE